VWGILGGVRNGTAVSPEMSRNAWGSNEATSISIDADDARQPFAIGPCLKNWIVRRKKSRRICEKIPKCPAAAAEGTGSVLNFNAALWLQPISIAKEVACHAIVTMTAIPQPWQTRAQWPRKWIS
jgi:hypothetical protein